jgi:predicted O-methyltransferase YrrM
MPARLRSLLTFGLSDLLSRLGEKIAALDTGVQAMRAEGAAGRLVVEDQVRRLEQDVAALRALLHAQDDRFQRKLRAGFSSAANLLSVLPHLKIDGVLPPFPHQGFEVPGEMAAFLYHLVRRHRPKLVLELGSGSSTVLLAASVRANGFGRVVSIEHDPGYRDRTAQFLRQTELSDRVDLIEAPLVEQCFGDLTLNWYDLAPLLRTLSEKIDFLFVDGPPGKTQPLSRYPALPALGRHLAAQALILVDDGRREDEARMVDLWRDLDGVSFDTEVLAFLPRSPILLTTPASENRVAELRRTPDARVPAAADEPDVIVAADRRGGLP